MERSLLVALALCRIAGTMKREEGKKRGQKEDSDTLLLAGQLASAANSTCASCRSGVVKPSRNPK
jgi:hypothetical protein